MSNPKEQRGIQYLLFSLRQRRPRTRQEMVCTKYSQLVYHSLSFLHQAGKQGHPLSPCANAFECLMVARSPIWWACARGRRGPGSIAI